MIRFMTYASFTMYALIVASAITQAPPDDQAAEKSVVSKNTEAVPDKHIGDAKYGWSVLYDTNGHTFSRDASGKGDIETSDGRRFHSPHGWPAPAQRPEPCEGEFVESWFDVTFGGQCMTLPTKLHLIDGELRDKNGKLFATEYASVRGQPWDFKDPPPKAPDDAQAAPPTINSEYSENQRLHWHILKTQQPSGVMPVHYIPLFNSRPAEPTPGVPDCDHNEAVHPAGATAATGWWPQ